MPPTNTIIVFLGPPGAGKGSQARVLSQIYCRPLLSIGDTLREIGGQKTVIGRKVSRALAAGELMDNEIIAEVLRQRTASSDCAKGYIIDGYPRNLNQAQWLDKWAVHQKNHVVAIYLSIQKDLGVKRALGRRNCTACGEVFNIYTRLPRSILSCDSCGNELEQRSDDVTQILEERYRVFESETLPLLEYYKDTDRLIALDGWQTEESVSRDLQGALRQRWSFEAPS